MDGVDDVDGLGPGAVHLVEAVDRGADAEGQPVASGQRTPQRCQHMVPNAFGVHRLAHLHQHRQMGPTAGGRTGAEPGLHMCEHGIGEGRPQMESQHGLALGRHLGEGEGTVVAGKRQRQQGRRGAEVGGAGEDPAEGLPADALLER